MDLRRFVLRVSRSAKLASNALSGWLVVRLIRLVRLCSRPHTADLVAAIMRMVGPRLKEHRIGREQLAAAFPEKPAAEIEKILAGVWDNLGRLAVEFAHIDRMKILDRNQVDAIDRNGAAKDDIIYDRRAMEICQGLRVDGKPALLFAAHLANWELAAYVAADSGLDLHLLYRRPSFKAVDEEVRALRAQTMGTLVPTALDAPVRLLRALEAGGHVAMHVDQYTVQGIDVTFFGRRTKANPLVAQLARHIDCPIHGARMIRLPDRNRFRIEMTEEIVPARDAEGRIDVAATMQIITSTIEGWIREYPDQWLWVHRRWR